MGLTLIAPTSKGTAPEYWVPKSSISVYWAFSNNFHSNGSINLVSTFLGCSWEGEQAGVSYKPIPPKKPELLRKAQYPGFKLFGGPISQFPSLKVLTVSVCCNEMVGA